MTSPVSKLYQLFIHYALAPDELSSKIAQASGMIIDAGSWVFTLEGLHRFILEDYPGLTFTEFQVLLYDSDLNSRLAQQGLRVEVHESRGKVKSNWYRLNTLPSN